MILLSMVEIKFPKIDIKILFVNNQILMLWFELVIVF